jgi:hypothetical protein
MGKRVFHLIDMSTYSRDRQLDLLRGIAVMGMFFFSFVLSLSDKLPILLEHNVPGRLLPGDFVLSLFLFSSGVSIALLRARYTSVLSRDLWEKILRRLAMMIGVSTLITPFSVGTFLGMDEVMLNAALTLPALLLAGLGLGSNCAVVALLAVTYDGLQRVGLGLPVSTVYLGGYAGAIFFLPVMIAGVLVCHEWRDRALPHTLAWAGIVALSWYLFGGPDKLSLTPSFMALSCSASALVLYLLGRFHITNRWLEYCGRHSLRMWVLMFVLLGPLRLYAEVSLHARRLSFEWWHAVAIAITWMAVSVLVSKSLDQILEKKRPATT